MLYWLIYERRKSCLCIFGKPCINSGVLMFSNRIKVKTGKKVKLWNKVGYFTHISIEAIDNDSMLANLFASNGTDFRNSWNTRYRQSRPAMKTSRLLTVRSLSTIVTLRPIPSLFTPGDIHTFFQNRCEWELMVDLTISFWQFLVWKPPWVLNSQNRIWCYNTLACSERDLRTFGNTVIQSLGLSDFKILRTGIQIIGRRFSNKKKIIW